ncbi:hypothetical protein TREMEDRAFT_24507 [Tremella mesenterica DSM 1558]|uniref:uncharacterized protein n=1 Tax=Tremella mesenterica (strain ATCC 24925 / CBS 8224 / DSM 1558 / NBRC 9311 / NRRL Y-6157 / RJB 2259-6 / UBC 559-6) TaxID=578456 RepID=UPI0003F490AE|nr:uncharacterized protein TREMEDRAFT_24507 [Tremella mesenterica DSM 1558]EIW73218.1 hypothetical protein TREMEDRAFT_24507 [Tremella mesenterica DSM 1558]
MSSSFWSSSHCHHWLVTRSSVAAARSIDLRYATPRQIYCLGIWFANLIQKLGKKLALRQIPIATATIFFRRFYLKNSYCETNPYLVLAACCFVAAKVEETPVHIKTVVSEAKLMFQENNIKLFPADPHKLGEMEFYLLEDLDFHLVIFHPYRALWSMTGREPADSGKFPQSRVEEDQEIKKREADAKKKRDEEIRKAGPGAATRVIDEVVEEEEEERIRRLMGRGSGEGLIEINEGAMQICQFMLNDTYRTEVHLLYPPYIIALAVICIALGLATVSNPAQSKTRSSSTQQNTLAQSTSISESLGIRPPSTEAAGFLASFNVSLPVLLACVQDIIVLYPIWETFEPSAARNQPQGPLAAATAAVQKDKLEVEGEDKFGPEEAEALVRRMIEERVVDVGHPDDAGVGTMPKLSGKKRGRQ